MTKKMSREYLEEIIRLAKRDCPDLYRILHSAAKAKAGGRAAHRVLEPDIIQKLALRDIKPPTLKDLPDSELKSIWLSLHQWYTNAKKRKKPVEDFVNAGVWVADELDRRKIQIAESDLFNEIERLREVRKARKQSVIGNRSQLPGHIEKLAAKQPDEILLVRDFVSLAGSAAVTEKPNDLDVIIRAKYDADKEGYMIDGNAMHVALRRFLTPDKKREMHLVDAPQGSFTDYIPLFDLVARKREMHINCIEPEPPNYNGKNRVIKSDSQKIVPFDGPKNAKIAFISPSPSLIESARGESIVGPDGETFNELYLKPLGMRRNEVLFGNAVPILLKKSDGTAREPTKQEVADWADWLKKQLSTHTPSLIVALGRTAQSALVEKSEFILPHPRLVRYYNSGEVKRKIKRIKERIFKQVKKPISKQDAEGGTRSAQALANWENKWHELLPISGKGRFTYQHHWRGLSEEEKDNSESELMNSQHSIHGDLRLEGSKVLWGASVFLGKASDNKKLPHNDKLIDWKKERKLAFAMKSGQPKEWLDVGKRKPFISKPGEFGATTKTYSKFFAVSSGTYRLGVARKHSIEIFLDSDDKLLQGRYMLVFAPVGGRRQWLIDKPEDQTPMAETNEPAELISELRRKRQKFLFWGKPGEKTQKIDVNTGRIAKNFEFKIFKAEDTDEELRIVKGVVLSPYGKNGADVDAHKDWVSPREVEDTANDWFLNSNRQVGLGHPGMKDFNIRNDVEVVQSYIEDYPTRKDFRNARAGKPHNVWRKPLGSDFVCSGDWVIATKLGEKSWKEFKEGKYNAYSIEGFGVKTKTPKSKLPDVKFIDLVPKS